jgi:glycine/D-amino acid oxidase-like deaminating enzyme
MSRIAVVGCGAFGALAAIRLAESGHDVTIYERNPRGLMGASLNNQNRLHLGYHYPRSDETCQQCILGFERFVEEFPDCVRRDFPNAYFIAEQDSKTTPQGFLDFCTRNGLSWSAFDESTFPQAVAGVSLGVICPEAIYDSRLLAERLETRMQADRIARRFGTAVTCIDPQGNGFRVSASDGSTVHYDGVINATYGNLSHVNAMIGHASPDRQYEYTVVPIIETGVAPFGVTIMDGPFYTVLPFGLGTQSLLYGVNTSVVATEIGRFMPQEWLNPDTSPFRPSDHAARWQQFVADAGRYFPDVSRWTLKGFLQGPRMVISNADATDERPSIVENPLPGYFSVFSGKVDHAIWVADELVREFAAVSG